MIPNRKNGFTLIELIIVIAIISILSLMGINAYTNVRRDARNSKRKADLKELKTTLESYYTRNGEYPATTPGASNGSGHFWQGACVGPDWASVKTVDSGINPDDYIPNLVPDYIPHLPHDPRENRPNVPDNYSGSNCNDAGRHCYLYSSNGSDYKILAYCTPEGTIFSDDFYADPQGRDYVWTVYSSSVSRSW